MTQTPYNQLGPDRLRAVVDDFVGRVYDDVMIGFFFRDFDRQRLKQLEFQFAARALGATDVEYEGRPLRDAHRKHAISGGQFARRTQILREVLRDHGVPASVQQAWLEHVQRMRPLVTGQPDEQCDPPQPVGPLVTHVPKKT